MSNVSAVTPIAVAGIPVAIAAVAVVAVAAAVTLLTEDTPADAEFRRQLRADRDTELLNRSQIELNRFPVSHSNFSMNNQIQRDIVSMPLSIREVNPLIQSAEKLGYQKMDMIASPKQKLSHSCTVLKNNQGDLLVLQQTETGTFMSTLKERTRLESVLKQHTLDRVSDHFAAKGMEMKSLTLANGEVQIQTQERKGSLLGGAAKINTQVKNDGSLVIDVNCIKGSRCENIVQGIADAIGGTRTSIMKKDSYYQLPGEPVKPTVQI